MEFVLQTRDHDACVIIGELIFTTYRSWCGIGIMGNVNTACVETEKPTHTNYRMSISDLIAFIGRGSVYSMWMKPDTIDSNHSDVAFPMRRLVECYWRNSRQVNAHDKEEITRVSAEVVGSLRRYIGWYIY